MLYSTPTSTSPWKLNGAPLVTNNTQSKGPSTFNMSGLWEGTSVWFDKSVSYKSEHANHMQIMLMNINEVDDKKWISHQAMDIIFQVWEHAQKSKFFLPNKAYFLILLRIVFNFLNKNSLFRALFLYFKYYKN